MRTDGRTDMTKPIAAFTIFRTRLKRFYVRTSVRPSDTANKQFVAIGFVTKKKLSATASFMKIHTVDRT